MGPAQGTCSPGQRVRPGKQRQGLVSATQRGSRAQRKGRWPGPGWDQEGPSTTQPGRAGAVRQHRAYLLGLLFPQVPHLFAEHAGAGPVLPDCGLPVLVVVHGLLCWEAPSYPPGAGCSARPELRSQHPEDRPVGDNGSPTTMQTPRALGAEGLQCGCGGRQTWGGGHTQREAFALRPRGQRPRCDFLSGELLCSGKTWAAFGEGPARSGPGVRSNDNSWGDTGQAAPAGGGELSRVPAECGPLVAGRTRSLREGRGTLLGLGRGASIADGKGPWRPWLEPGGHEFRGGGGADATEAAARLSGQARPGHTASASSSVEWVTALGGT